MNVGIALCQGRFCYSRLVRIPVFLNTLVYLFSSSFCVLADTIAEDGLPFDF